MRLESPPRQRCNGTVTLFSNFLNLNIHSYTTTTDGGVWGGSEGRVGRSNLHTTITDGGVCGGGVVCVCGGGGGGSCVWVVFIVSAYM